MKKKLYNVCVPIHASTNVQVEAKSVKEAITLATDIAHSPGLCHQCSGKLELGDPDTDAITEDMVSED